MRGHIVVYLATFYSMLSKDCGSENDSECHKYTSKSRNLLRNGSESKQKSMKLKFHQLISSLSILQLTRMMF